MGAAQLISFFKNSDETSALVGQRQAMAFQALAGLCGKGEPLAARTSPSPKVMSTATKVVAKKTKESADGARAAVAKTSPPPAPLASSPAPPPTGKRMPAIYIDVQVHISPDTSPEQIDRIFASMAKHLGGFVG